MDVIIEPLTIRINRVIKLRVFESKDKSWSKNVMDMKYEILSVSQFTLYASINKGKINSSFM